MGKKQVRLDILRSLYKFNEDHPNRFASIRELLDQDEDDLILVEELDEGLNYLAGKGLIVCDQDVYYAKITSDGIDYVEKYPQNWVGGLMIWFEENWITKIVGWVLKPVIDLFRGSK